MSTSLEAKIVVLGSQGVGKTSLVNRYVKNDFNPAATTSTVGASFVTKRVLDETSDTLVRLQIWDTAGQERFRSISRLYYRGANACLLCYDITDESSFQEMTGWLLELKENITNDDDEQPVVIHVVGTKSDIVAVEPMRRRVPFERTIAYVAEQLYPSRASTPPPTATAASMMGLVFPPPPSQGTGGLSGLHSPDSKRSSGFWGQDIGWDCCHEISAKDGEGIEEVFRVITRKLVEQRNRRETLLLAASQGTTPGGVDGGGGGGVPNPLGPGSFDSNGGSFRLGHGDKRRSWLGFPPSGVGEENAGNVSMTEDARRKKGGGCC